MDPDTLTEIAIFINYHKQAAVLDPTADAAEPDHIFEQRPTGFLDSIDLSN